MKESVYNSAISLSQAIKNDIRLLDMKEKEERMMNSLEVIHLSHRLEEAQSDYSNALSLNNKEEIVKSKKRLHEAKVEIDSHPLVKEYNEAYIKVRDLYMEIDDIIFGPYRKKTIVREESK